jgi:hypothetical protein
MNMNARSNRPNVRAFAVALALGIAAGFFVGLAPLLDCPGCHGEGKKVVGFDGSGIIRPTLTGAEFPRLRPIIHCCEVCHGCGRIALWDENSFTDRSRKLPEEKQ